MSGVVIKGRGVRAWLARREESMIKESDAISRVVGKQLLEEGKKVKKASINSKKGILSELDNGGPLYQFRVAKKIEWRHLPRSRLSVHNNYPVIVMGKFNGVKMFSITCVSNGSGGHLLRPTFDVKGMKVSEFKSLLGAKRAATRVLKEWMHEQSINLILL